jgi:hypothetical protein
MSSSTAILQLPPFVVVWTEFMDAKKPDSSVRGSRASRTDSYLLQSNSYNAKRPEIAHSGGFSTHYPDFSAKKMNLDNLLLPDPEVTPSGRIGELGAFMWEETLHAKKFSAEALSNSNEKNRLTFRK